MRVRWFAKRLISPTAIMIRLVIVVVLLAFTRPTPESARITDWLTAADETAQAGRYDDALVIYNRMLNYSTRFQPVVYERLVEMSVRVGQYSEARVYLYQLVDHVGWNQFRRKQLETILERSGETALAEALLRASLTQHQDNPHALRILAQEQIERLDWQQARETLDQLAAFQPDEAETMYLLGLLLAPQDQALAADYLARVSPDSEWFTRAETVYAALAVYDTYALTDAHTYLGVTLVGLAEWPFAEQALQMALEVNAVNPTALAYLGFVRDQQGRDGLPDLQAAVDMAPTDPNVYYLFGQHWRMVQDDEAALDAFNAAYWLDPSNPALAAEVALSLQFLSNLAEAQQWFQIAIDLAPEDVRWNRLMAVFYADTGYQLEGEGLDFIQEASELAPADPDIRASLGWAYHETGDTDQAYEELSTALTLDPQNPRSRYYFGRVLETMGNKDAALDAYWFVVQEFGPDTGFGLLADRALDRLGYGLPG
jgi:tetratricopeptide (TPR) repeat protein